MDSIHKSLHTLDNLIEENLRLSYDLRRMTAPVSERAPNKTPDPPKGVGTPANLTDMTHVPSMLIFLCQKVVDANELINATIQELCITDPVNTEF